MCDPWAGEQLVLEQLSPSGLCPRFCAISVRGLSGIATPRWLDLPAGWKPSPHTLLVEVITMSCPRSRGGDNRPQSSVRVCGRDAKRSLWDGRNVGAAVSGQCNGPQLIAGGGQHLGSLQDQLDPDVQRCPRCLSTMLASVSGWLPPCWQNGHNS